MPDFYCPFCGTNKNKCISESLYYCKKCQHVINLNHKHISYDKDYFLSEYENQYGKTYINDYENIYRVSVKRINRIKNILGINSSYGCSTPVVNNSLKNFSLLDLGCALGFFLKAAQDQGAEPLLGIEISEFASKYCTSKFSINVLNGNIETKIKEIDFIPDRH